MWIVGSLARSNQRFLDQNFLFSYAAKHIDLEVTAYQEAYFARDWPTVLAIRELYGCQNILMQTFYKFSK